MPRLLLLLALFVSSPVHAIDPGGRLLATGGVSQIEGAAGGGLTPWALIAGYGTDRQVGVTVFGTTVLPADFDLVAGGVAVGIRDRVEISYARHRFGLGSTVPGQTISQDIVGLKVKVLGDAVFDQDRWWPQVAVGLQYKHNQDMAVPTLLGAKRSEDFDFYVSATKVWFAALLGRNVLLNGTLRATRANQFGLLGFGGDLNDHHQVVPEVSAGVFLNDRWVLGAEYRQKPNNLGAFREDAIHDVFIAWFPLKMLSITGAYADLGRIADKDNQRAVYLSFQLAF